jgi:predicted transcriptional regulator
MTEQNGYRGVQITLAVAFADGPVTVSELAEALDVSEAKIHYTAQHLWRSGYLLRRKRTASGFQNDPYEYTLPPEVDPW